MTTSSSSLGESWAMTSVPQLTNVNADKGEREARKSRSDYGSDSISESPTMSASSVSGPELVMPSIYEAHISESSWVAPTVRASDGTLPTRRHKREVLKSKADEDGREKRDKHIQTTNLRAQYDGTFARALASTPLRTMLNLALILGILHLLVFPEIVYQYGNLCTISTISIIYPASCVSRFRPQSKACTRDSRCDPVFMTQVRLESIIGTTLAQTAPLINNIRESDIKLRRTAASLKEAYPGRRNELDLEFDGCWRTVRDAVRNFDLLVVDMRSAIDSLRATSSWNLGSDPGVGSKEERWKPPVQAEVVKEARSMTQIHRRKQYLEQLIERIWSKAESLSIDLGVLDTHLESITDIVGSECRRDDLKPEGLAYLRTVLHNLPKAFAPFLQIDGQTRGSGSPQKRPIGEIFEDAVSCHRPVAETARNLSLRLQDLWQAR